MAGGMLYRCRWCERAFCEDCLDFDKTTLIGNNLPEYEILGYPEMAQAFYIQCGICTDNFKAHPEDKALVDEIAANISLEHERKFPQHPVSDDGLTDVSTVDPSSVNTPILIDDEYEQDVLSSKKRKVIGDTLHLSVKREKLGANITR
jgi:SWI/SNF-related matrix-associated actin-dependent regulator of chromatin subfamily A member 5